MTFIVLPLPTDVVTLLILYFQSPGVSPDWHGFANMVESDLATTLANSLSGSHRHICSSSSGDQETDLIRKEALFSSSPDLAFHPLKRRGKRD